ncbi:DNA-binding transcriptional regulator, AcrR family [Thermomonospora echinospora]|uniref:DNA-binding transcriptional regulator, AcrR family n=1 Tax=Thermomonospora echinospora TaxID=1992 RepID=A0A1H6E553_9ACTN|nr:TetR/AcrR family transcriptional regulator [Thermomonospora echinospora]SEG92820.1 DNA-binding transcriptional regulator, AcrR family [Thermomonospora echinospora]
MARTHGWRGDQPGDDVEARGRIIEATMRCIDRYGAKTRLADVAKELGVTRQTVYFYFAGTEELLVAAAQHAVGDFLDRLAAHVAPISGDAEILAEGMLHTIQELPNDPYLGILLASGHTGTFTQSITSPTAMALGRMILTRFDIDWTARDYTATDLDELVELMLRLLQSFVIDPGHPPRSPEEFRAYLRRWFSRLLHSPSPATADGG